MSAMSSNPTDASYPCFSTPPAYPRDLVSLLAEEGTACMAPLVDFALPDSLILSIGAAVLIIRLQLASFRPNDSWQLFH